MICVLLLESEMRYENVYILYSKEKILKGAYQSKCIGCHAICKILYISNQFLVFLSFPRWGFKLQLFINPNQSIFWTIIGKKNWQFQAFKMIENIDILEFQVFDDFFSIWVHVFHRRQCGNQQHRQNWSRNLNILVFLNDIEIVSNVFGTYFG